MDITVNVELGANETLAYTPDAAAGQVLAALGGNATKDYCVCYVHSSDVPGTAGTPSGQPAAAAAEETT
jgi:hypothetical protein